MRPERPPGRAFGSAWASFACQTRPPPLMPRRPWPQAQPAARGAFSRLSNSAGAAAVILTGTSAEYYNGQQNKEEYVIPAKAVAIIQKQHKQNEEDQKGISVLLLDQVVNHSV